MTDTSSARKYGFWQAHLLLMRRITVFIVCGFALAALSPSDLSAVESHPGISVESAYSEAVLAYNKKQSGQAIEILNQLLAAHPNHIEGLELMALSLREKGDEKKALEVYERLIKVKPEAERGPYHFELGMILHKQKRVLEAKPHFEKAARLRFNKNTAHLFLGMITFEKGDLNAAETNFNEVKTDSNPELRMLGHYYLGMIHFKNGYGAGGTHELTLARNIARDLGSSSKMAKDIRQASEKILEPFNLAQWFGNMTLLTQYDSNIATLPTGMSSASASNKAAPNLLLNGGLGYMTSPTHTLQWVGNYRFSFNKTLNSETKQYEYFSHTPAMFFNISPLSRTTGGLKLEGNLTFQNQPKIAGQSSGAYIFRKYSVYAEAAPYFRYELRKNVQSEMEVSYQKVTNDSDTTQNGNLIAARGSVKSTSASSMWNPGGAISLEKLNAQGTDSKYSATGLSFFNTMKLSAEDILNFALDYTMTQYPDSSTARSDRNFTARASLVHSLTTKWTLLGDLTVIKNTSNLTESYAYDRFMIGAGLGWTL